MSDLDQNYKRAFSGSLPPGKRPALLLIDFVQAYFDTDCPLYADVQAELDVALQVRSVARDAGIPVVYTNVVFTPGGLDGGRFFQKVEPLRNFQRGSAMGAWPAGLTPDDNELIVSKQYPSAFFGTSLVATLNAAGVDTVILTGLTTSGCVRATCVDAISYGFIPLVVSDACGDRHEAPHEANLFDMQAKYADVMPAADVNAYLKSL